MIKMAAAAGLALTLAAGSALAADLPNLKAPIVAPPPVFSWTGLYGGVNIGYGFGNGDQDRGGLFYPPFSPCCVGIPLAGSVWSISNDPHGVLGGGQVGYNYQFNPWLVVGLEADIQASDVHSQGIGVGGAADLFGPHFAYATQNKSVDWFGTVRGRVGLAFPSLPNLLFYGTGGLAYGNVIQSVNVTDIFASLGNLVVGAGANYDKTKTGWTAGGGVEWVPAPAHPLFHAFSIKLEYLYTDLGPTTLYGVSIATIPPGGPTFFYTQTSQTRWHTIRTGVNWRFNPFAPDPVLASY